VPASVNTVPRDGRPACTYCGTCAGFVCHNDSRGTARNTFLAKALATGNVAICPGTQVTSVVVGHGSKVEGLNVIGPNGERYVQRARLFILACYTFENVRLLLLSKSLAHPNGLGNNRRQVGKHFMTKQYYMTRGVLEGKRLSRFMASSPQAVLIDDFVGDNFDHANLGFIRGATINCQPQQQPVRAAIGFPPPPGVRRWGQSFKEYFVRQWDSVVNVNTETESLPYEDAFLDLDPDRVDPITGDPVIRITWDLHPNEHRIMDHVGAAARRILDAMGAAPIWHGHRRSGVLSAHDFGGCRMGVDPAESVVDPSLRVHDCDNLYVMGGAVFPTGSSINPTLTIHALTWRAAEELAASWAHGRRT
jgi:gluconate 2-dehydrogenase alpha chain